jgi:hypothetical protein
MNATSTKARGNPVDARALNKLVLLEAELMQLDASLRNFDRLRDSMTAAGDDPNLAYNQIVSRRSKVLAERKRQSPGSPNRHAPMIRPRANMGETLLDTAVAPATYEPTGRRGVFGFAGLVQMGPPYELEDVVPQELLGGINTNWTAGGFVAFNGEIMTTEPTLEDYLVEHFALHSWCYVVPFPAPVIDSVLTYEVHVNASANLQFDEIPIQEGIPNLPIGFWIFAAVGQAEQWAGPSQTIAVDSIAGWPLIADLQHNGSVQSFVGNELIVKRSFDVGPGQTPAIALAVGAAVALPPVDGLGLYIDDYSGIGAGRSVPSAGTGDGVVTFRYDPKMPSVVSTEP